MNSPKSVQASVTILENLHVILKKCQKDEVNNEIMPLLYNALDNNTNQIQVSENYLFCNLHTLRYTSHSITSCLAA